MTGQWRLAARTLSLPSSQAPEQCQLAKCGNSVIGQAADAGNGPVAPVWQDSAAYLAVADVALTAGRGPHRPQPDRVVDRP